MNSSSNTLRLKSITPGGDFKARLTWSDDRIFEPSYLDLRYYCPCASCVDEITGERRIRRGDLKPDMKPMKIEPVGNYALKFTWSDGHSTGIYSYDTLRKICEEA